MRWLRRTGLPILVAATLVSANLHAAGDDGDDNHDAHAIDEIALGRYRLFLNLENLLNVRQTREDPLVRPSRAADGRWTVDAWAPIDGFVANAGMRIRF